MIAWRKSRIREANCIADGLFEFVKKMIPYGSEFDKERQRALFWRRFAELESEELRKLEESGISN
jgi:hypothetical protein